MVLVADPNNSVIYSNKTGQNFFSDLADKNQSIFKLLQLDKNEIEAVNGWRKTNEATYQIHEKHYVSDTGESYLNIAVNRLVLDGVEAGYTYIVSDVTSRKMIYDNQWQIRKMETLSTLAGGFAHDFNNLMTIILGNLDVYHYVSDEDKRNDIIASMKEAAVKASELVKQVLIFSKQDKMTIQPVVVEEHIERVLKLAKKSLPSNVQLIDALGTESTVVLVDANQFIQVILNLIFNSRDAILRKQNSQKNKDKSIGRIEISSEIIYIDRLLAEQLTVVEGKYVKLGISDDGAGISPDIKPLVFDPFFTTKGGAPRKGSAWDCPSLTA
jgi:signal transduction histidine kinase